MSLLYRAIWSDTTESDRLGVLSQARQRLSRWALDDPGAGVLEDGEHTLDLVGQSPRHRTITLRSITTDVVQGVEAVVVDVPRDGAETNTVWTTTVRLAVTDEGVHTWLDNAVESEDATLRVKVGRPRVVDDLLALPGRPMAGGSAVLPSALAVSAGEVSALAEVLRQPERSLPYIVFSQPRVAVGDSWLHKARQTATRVAGVAVVVTLDTAAAAALRRELGELAVWNGAVRTYVPARLDDLADGYRHRYLLPDRLAMGGAVDRLVFAVTQMSTRRRVPAVFTSFLDRVVPAASEQASGDEEVELQLLQAEEDLDSVTRELNLARGHLERIAVALRERGEDELFWSARDMVVDPESLPDEVQDTSDAILTAQQHLTDWLVLPGSAVQELDGIDAAPNAYAWGGTTWRGLRALAAFAEARAAGFHGDFWGWCLTGPPLGWPATTKKLAMRESETVQKNKKFKKAREFEIDTDVAASGRIHMQAHPKISEGGGDLAPRVYFHDDTAGRTGKIHVGFVGPHHLVPNTKS